MGSANAPSPVTRKAEASEAAFNSEKGDRERDWGLGKERSVEGERESGDWGKAVVGRDMGCESPVASPAGKRGRDPDEEVYLDNFHSHKRYLSEIMASSLNGLTVGDSLAENLMESPARFESICYPRDESSSQYSPMSEDSDDSRFGENPINYAPEIATNHVTPVSPHRHQRIQVGAVPTMYAPLPSCTLTSVICSHSRQRGSDNDSRFPSSPNDVCHTADLRRTALLRSVQIRTQGEEKQYSFVKDDVGYQSPEREGEDYIEDCSPVDGLNE